MRWEERGCERTMGRRRKCQELGSRALGASLGPVGWRAGLAGKGGEWVMRSEGVKWEDKRVPRGRVKDLGDFSRARAGTAAGGWAAGRGLPERGLGVRPSPAPLGHLLEGPALGYSLGAEVQQRLGSAPAAHGPGPGIALLRSRGAAPTPLGRGGVHRPGPGRVLLRGGRSDARSASPAPATPTRLPVLPPRRAAPGPPLLPPPQRAGPAG